jgi:hypothetical protein
MLIPAAILISNALIELALYNVSTFVVQGCYDIIQRSYTRNVPRIQVCNISHVLSNRGSIACGKHFSIANSYQLGQLLRATTISLA